MHIATKNIDQLLQLTPWIQALFIICCAVDFALTLYFANKTIIGIIYHIACCIQLERGRRERK
jgi:hypothetical protein